MNRKERRRMRRYGNRENYLRKRRHWAKAGPPIVLDDPTPEHVQALLMEWLIPQQVVHEVLEQVSNELTDQQVRRMESRMWYYLVEAMMTPEATRTAKDELWCRLVETAKLDLPRPMRTALA